MTQPLSLSPAPVQYSVIWERKLQAAFNNLGAVWGNDLVSGPVAGFAHQIPISTGTCLLVPAGTIANGTVTLPASALEGFEQQIASSQQITALAVAANSGQTIVGATSFLLAAGSSVVYRFVAATSTWYKIR